jgi:hypothetical protein
MRTKLYHMKCRAIAHAPAVPPRVCIGSEADVVASDGFSPLSAMCGRLPVGKSKLHVAALVGAAMCSAC